MSPRKRSRKARLGKQNPEARTGIFGPLRRSDTELLAWALGGLIVGVVIGGDDVSGVPDHDSLAGGDSSAVPGEDGEKHPPEYRDGAGVCGDVQYRAVFAGPGRVSVPNTPLFL